MQDGVRRAPVQQVEVDPEIDEAISAEEADIANLTSSIEEFSNSIWGAVSDYHAAADGVFSGYGSDGLGAFDSYRQEHDDGEIMAAVNRTDDATKRSLVDRGPSNDDYTAFSLLYDDGSVSGKLVDAKDDGTVTRKTNKARKLGALLSSTPDAAEPENMSDEEFKEWLEQYLAARDDESADDGHNLADDDHAFFTNDPRCPTAVACVPYYAHINGQRRVVGSMGVSSYWQNYLSGKQRAEAEAMARAIVAKAAAKAERKEAQANPLFVQHELGEAGNTATVRLDDGINEKLKKRRFSNDDRVPSHLRIVPRPPVVIGASKQPVYGPQPAGKSPGLQSDAPTIATFQDSAPKRPDVGGADTYDPTSAYELTPDQQKLVDERKQRIFSEALAEEVAKAGAGKNVSMAIASFVPGAGEIIDVAILLDPESTWEMRGFAIFSLGVNMATSGFAPNFGAFGRGTLRSGGRSRRSCHHGGTVR